MEKFVGGFVVVIGVLVVGVGLAILMAYPTMWAWNYVMPYLFHFPTVSVWQAFSLNFLACTFTKPFSTGGTSK